VHASNTWVDDCALLLLLKACVPSPVSLLLYVVCSADGDADDLDNTNKSFQEGAFATLYTLTKSRQLDASLRLSILKVVLEFLQVSTGSFGQQCTAGIKTLYSSSLYETGT
jgi:hypothetical protein